MMSFITDNLMLSAVGCFVVLTILIWLAWGFLIGLLQSLGEALEALVSFVGDNFGKVVGTLVLALVWTFGFMYLVDRFFV